MTLKNLNISPTTDQCIERLLAVVKALANEGADMPSIMAALAGAVIRAAEKEPANKADYLNSVAATLVQAGRQKH